VCDVIVEHFSSSALISGDWFLGRWRRGAIDPWLAEAHSQTKVAAKAAAVAAGAFADADGWVIYDGVVRPRDLPCFLAETGLAGLHYAVLLPAVATCAERVARRAGHGFTSTDATRAMHADFADTAIPAPQLFAGVSGSPEDVATQLLLRLCGGDLLWSGVCGSISFD